MTNGKVIEILEDICAYRDWLPLDCDDCGDDSGMAIKIAIKALEKQEPKKPNETLILWEEKWCIDYRCPVCDRYVNIGGGKLEYCPNCGQAIDWGNEDEE